MRVNCLDGAGIQLMPTARIKVAVPTEVTPELLAQLEAEKSKRELVAKTQGKGRRSTRRRRSFRPSAGSSSSTGRRIVDRHR